MTDYKNRNWSVCAILTIDYPFPREKLIITKRYEKKYLMGKSDQLIILSYKNYVSLKQ